MSVFTGPERRRDWPDERKIAIVSESLEPGVNVSELARRHEINPQQLFGWRRRFRADAEALIAARSTAPACFAPILVETSVASAVVAPPAAAGVNDARSRSRSAVRRCAFAARPTSRRWHWSARR